MASSATASCTKGTTRVLSLLSSRCATTSTAAAAKMSNSRSAATATTSNCYSVLVSNRDAGGCGGGGIDTPSSAFSSSSSLHIRPRPHSRPQLPSFRHFSKYMEVDHSQAYQNAINSQHGLQLRLALEEGRGKDDAPFDPFSQFLDQMGYDVTDDEEGKEEEEGDGEEDDGILNAVNNAIDDDDDDDDQTFAPSLYKNDGSLIRPKSQQTSLRAGYPSHQPFAVVRLAGFQHKVTAHDLLVVNKLKPTSHWCVGSTHTLKDEDVLLMADTNKTLVGLPCVKGGEVDVMVEEITRDKTVVVFKKRRRKNSRRKNGFRREVTFLRVLDVRMPGEEAGKVEGNLGSGGSSGAGAGVVSDGETMAA
ncbi:hypothetical protein ACHAXS_002686 [Conticribra weissflogii]